MSGTRAVAPEVVELLLREALELDDASLVIYRRGVLIEFKTTLLLPGLSATLEGSHKGWQVGPYEGHHCHLDLASIERVWFDAEPVSCQGGRLNYTAWFMAATECGNPYRPHGLFSVTLNAPYDGEGSARLAVIEPLVALHDRHADRDGVCASDAFLAARAALGR